MHCYCEQATVHNDIFKVHQEESKIPIKKSFFSQMKEIMLNNIVLLDIKQSLKINGIEICIFFFKA